MKLRPQGSTEGWRRLCINGRQTALRVRLCSRFLARLVGWGMGAYVKTSGARPSVLCGVWLQPCDSIHTLWLRHTIDVAFVDAAGRIQRVCSAVPPRRVRCCRGACAVLELPSGSLAQWGLETGVRVELSGWGS